MGVSNLIIRDLGPKGDGIHESGRTRVYVERALPGDEILGNVQRDPAGIARAEIVEIVRPSPMRQRPPCPHYEACGNCTLQHLQEGYYREWKQEMVADAFRRHGLIPRRWQETVFVGDGNRRRATFSARRQRGKVVIGYYRRRSHEIADIRSCLIADPRLLKLREQLRPGLTQILHGEEALDVFLQITDEAADCVLTGPLGRRGVPDERVQEVLSSWLRETIIQRVSWSDDDREDARPLLSKGPVSVAFGELTVNLPPGAFLQPTPEGEAALVDAVMAALPAQGKLADLFSGSGTFSGPMTSLGSVDAFESGLGAVKALSHAARGRDLRVYRRDLFANPLSRQEANRYDAIVFDPPRGGCPEQVSQLADAKTGVLVGVSCNPATFARDARILCEGGYWLQSLRIVDQFRWSHHVEVVGVFTRSRSKR